MFRIQGSAGSGCGETEPKSGWGAGAAGVLVLAGGSPPASSTVLHTVGDGYALDVSQFDVDLVRFQGLARAATEARHSGDKHRAAELLRSALALWHGPPVADIPVLAAHSAVTWGNGGLKRFATATS